MLIEKRKSFPNPGNRVLWPSCYPWDIQTGVKATGWELDRVLKAMWKLFNDSLARRELYINLNRSDNFLLMLCQTRWVEDESVASRAINIWTFVVSAINHYESLSKSKRPKNNKSYDLLVKHMTDDLMLVKF